MSGAAGTSGVGGAAGATPDAGAAGGTTGSGSGGSSGGSAGTAGSGGKAGAGGARPDAGNGGTTVDAGPPDTGRPDTIRCGNTACAPDTHFCCIPQAGQARCVLNTAPNNCPIDADTLRCDDRSDCEATQVCCAQLGFTGGSTATCRSAATCNNGPAGRTEILCNPETPNTCTGGGTNSCRVDNQTIIPGYPSCH
jgi:hypothetical protein